MTNTVAYNKLLNNYRDLQLRVTRFSIVEQELINTRDKLDHELELHKRLNNFNERAWTCDSDDKFIRLVVESIVDILEVEKAIFFVQPMESEHSRFYFEGTSPDFYIKKQLIEDLSIISMDWPQNKSHLISKEYLDQLPSFKLDNQQLLFRFNESSLNLNIIMIGAISSKKAPLYSELEERHRTIFSVFAQQVKSHFTHRSNQKKIEDQILKISRSQLELKKLSLIATKTKNGVIITDKKGQIEWVNEAFEKMTEYELREVVGKKPKDFLQRDASSIETSKKISEALALKQNIETTIINHTKSGRLYYNQLEITPVFDQNGEHTNFISLQKDITQELSIREEIMRINNRYEQITSHAKIGIWEWDIKLNKVTWNDVLKEQYGLTNTAKNQSLYNFWLQSIKSSDQRRVNEQIEKLQSGKSLVEQLEYSIIRGERNEERILECITIAERDLNNQLIRLIGSSIDVTEIRLSEQRLKTSEEKYRSIIENMNIGLVEKNEKNEVLYANKTFLIYNQNTNNQLTENTNRPFEDKKNVNNTSSQTSQNNVENKTEISIKDIKGKELTYLMSQSPVLDSSKKLKGSIQTFLDITALKSLQTNLQDTIGERDSYINKISNLKSFYENILKEAPAEIGVLSPKLQLTYFNQKSNIANHSWTQLHRYKNGYNKNEDQFTGLLLETVEMSILARSIQQAEEIITHEDGSRNHKLHSVLPYFGSDDKLEYLIISAVDITPLKQSEEKVIQSNVELKKINTELDNFVYSVSHDLRSPLLAIKGIVKLIMDQIAHDSGLLPYLHRIITSVNRLDDTIQEILEYSRNSRMELSLEEIDIEAQVNEIFNDLRFAAETEIEFQTQIEGSALIITDKARMSTLLKNLIANSIKYRNRKIEKPYVHFRLEHFEDSFCITIEDNGEGISEKNLPRVFEMFYRATNTNIGTGLGLYIVSEIAQKLQGKIEIQSEIGVGTTLKIRFNTLKK